MSRTAGPNPFGRGVHEFHPATPVQMDVDETGRGVCALCVDAPHARLFRRQRIVNSGNRTVLCVDGAVGHQPCARYARNIIQTDTHFLFLLKQYMQRRGILQKLFLIVPHHELQRGIPLCAVLLGRGKIGVPVSCSLRQRAAGAFSVPMINVQIFHSAFQRVQRVQIFCSRKANRRLPERAQPRRFTQQSQR